MVFKLHFLSNFDLFGKPIIINYKDRQTVRTSFGGVMSLIVIGLIALFFWSKVTSILSYKHQLFLIRQSISSTRVRRNEKQVHKSQNYISLLDEVSVVSFRTFYQDPSLLDLSTDEFMFGVRITQTNFTTNPYYNITLEQRHYTLLPNGTQVTQSQYLNMEPCTQSHWKMMNSSYSNFNSTFYTIGLNDYLCPKQNQTLKIGGQIQSQDYYFLKLSVLKCTSTNQTVGWQPKCRSQTEVYSYQNSSSIRVQFQVSNHLINPNEVKNLVQKMISSDIFFQIQPTQLYLTADIFFTEYSVNTDKSVFISKENQKDIFPVQEYGDFRPQTTLPLASSNTYANFYFNRGRYSQDYHRSYMKLQDLLSQIGGFVQSMIAFTSIIVGFYNNNYYQMEMANNFYDFEINDDDDESEKQEEKQKTEDFKDKIPNQNQEKPSQSCQIPGNSITDSKYKYNEIFQNPILLNHNESLKINSTINSPIQLTQRELSIPFYSTFKDITAAASADEQELIIPVQTNFILPAISEAENDQSKIEFLSVGSSIHKDRKTQQGLMNQKTFHIKEGLNNAIPSLSNVSICQDIKTPQRSNSEGNILNKRKIKNENKEKIGDCNSRAKVLKMYLPYHDLQIKKLDGDNQLIQLEDEGQSQNEEQIKNFVKMGKDSIKQPVGGTKLLNKQPPFSKEYKKNKEGNNNLIPVLSRQHHKQKQQKQDHFLFTNQETGADQLISQAEVLASQVQLSLESSRTPQISCRFLESEMLKGEDNQFEMPALSPQPQQSANDRLNKHIISVHNNTQIQKIDKVKISSTLSLNEIESFSQTKRITVDDTNRKITSQYLQLGQNYNSQGEQECSQMGKSAQDLTYQNKSGNDLLRNKNFSQVKSSMMIENGQGDEINLKLNSFDKKSIEKGILSPNDNKGGQLGTKNIEPDKKQSLFQPNTFLGNEIDKLNKKRKKIKFSVSYFLYKLTCGKCFRNRRNQMIEKAQQLIVKDLDINKILDKIQEIDRIKLLLLEQEQVTLFNYFPRPVVQIDQHKHIQLISNELLPDKKGSSSLNIFKIMLKAKNKLKGLLKSTKGSNALKILDYSSYSAKNKKDQSKEVVDYEKLFSAYRKINQKEQKTKYQIHLFFFILKPHSLICQYRQDITPFDGERTAIYFSII